MTNRSRSWATLLPQSLWVLGVTAWSSLRCGTSSTARSPGQAMLATSFNRTGGRTGRDQHQLGAVHELRHVGALGALGGILVTPITLTSYDVGIMLGLKGFVAAVVGGLGNGLGAVLGGLLVGVLEAMGAGYISSAYKDAIPFVLILFILFFMPRGLFGGKSTDRV